MQLINYPDFLLYTKSGKVILLETIGDDRDNSGSDVKCRLGNPWAQLAGSGFNFFMVFESKPVAGAYHLSKAKELLAQL